MSTPSCMRDWVRMACESRRLFINLLGFVAVFSTSLSYIVRSPTCGVLCSSSNRGQCHRAHSCDSFVLFGAACFLGRYRMWTNGADGGVRDRRSVKGLADGTSWRVTNIVDWTIVSGASAWCRLLGEPHCDTWSPKTLSSRQLPKVMH